MLNKDGSAESPSSRSTRHVVKVKQHPEMDRDGMGLAETRREIRKRLARFGGRV
jgi:hypothetical protein